MQKKKEYPKLERPELLRYLAVVGKYLQLLSLATHAQSKDNSLDVYTLMKVRGSALDFIMLTLMNGQVPSFGGIAEKLIQENFQIHKEGLKILTNEFDSQFHMIVKQINIETSNNKTQIYQLRSQEDLIQHLKQQQEYQKAKLISSEKINITKLIEYQTKPLFVDSIECQDKLIFQELISTTQVNQDKLGRIIQSLKQFNMDTVFMDYEDLWKQGDSDSRYLLMVYNVLGNSTLRKLLERVIVRDRFFQNKQCIVLLSQSSKHSLMQQYEGGFFIFFIYQKEDVFESEEIFARVLAESQLLKA